MRKFYIRLAYGHVCGRLSWSHIEVVGAQPTVPRPVVLGCIRKPPEKELVDEPANKFPPWFLLQDLAMTSSIMDGDVKV